MKIALAQTNSIIGDLDGNAVRIIEHIKAARQAGADLVVFSELSVTGYPPKDLLLKPHFIKRNLQAVERIAKCCDGIFALVGFAQPNPTGQGKDLYNAAAICANGRIVGTRGKRLLPTYDVFDETRYFASDKTSDIATLDLPGGPVKVGITICEDLWNNEGFAGRPIYRTDPIAEAAAEGAEVLINLSASPFSVGKQATRLDIFGRQAAEHRLPIVYVNQVGGNDELIFDGASAYLDGTGRLVAQAAAFDEDLLVFDTNDTSSARVDPYPDDLASVHRALVLGTRDYVRKCGFTDVVVGLSGGIDSALTAALATAALGADRVHGVLMPSRFSSGHSVEDARALAERLGFEALTLPIDAMHGSFEAVLAEPFAGRSADVTEENLQARIRGVLLMALSNKFGWLVLATGNKSEMSVGYCTLYGDMCGGLAVLSDVPKTMVYALARWINEQAGKALIPVNTIDKAPSAELKADQTDQDVLPEYDVLDAILQRYVEQEQSREQLLDAGFDRDVVEDVIRRVDANEYKRQQAATGLKVTSRAFGIGRRMPIAARSGL